MPLNLGVERHRLPEMRGSIEVGAIGDAIPCVFSFHLLNSFASDTSYFAPSERKRYSLLVPFRILVSPTRKPDNP